jgi:hypothetical protein
MNGVTPRSGRKGLDPAAVTDRVEECRVESGEPTPQAIPARSLLLPEHMNHAGFELDRTGCIPRVRDPRRSLDHTQEVHVTKFQSTLIAIALLAGTGCYATVRVPDGHSSSRPHGEANEHQGKDGHAQSNHGSDRDHD